MTLLPLGVIGDPSSSRSHRTPTHHGGCHLQLHQGHIAKEKSSSVHAHCLPVYMGLDAEDLDLHTEISGVERAETLLPIPIGTAVAAVVGTRIAAAASYGGGSCSRCSRCSRCSHCSRGSRGSRGSRCSRCRIQITNIWFFIYFFFSIFLYFRTYIRQFILI